MLKNIPPILSPELLKVLAEMGHGDRICIGDGNFGASMASPITASSSAPMNTACPNCSTRFCSPLDEYVEHPVMIMQVAEKDKGMEIPIWDEYKKIVAKYDARVAKPPSAAMSAFEFYDEARKTYCILQSGETAIYANVILQKGVIKQAKKEAPAPAGAAALLYYFFPALTCSRLCWRRLGRLRPSGGSHLQPAGPFWSAADRPVRRSEWRTA